MRGIAVLVLGIALGGCSNEADWGADLTNEGAADTNQGLSVPAICELSIDGVSNVDVENEYLPRVIACENGDATDEALRAQAVISRTYLYYHLNRGVVAQNSEGFQVYSCDRTNGDISRYRDIVSSTAGQILVQGGNVICSFFAAGTIPSTPSCVPSITDNRDNDPLRSEWAITYNYCRSDVEVDYGYQGQAVPENRGSLSQNGADCLSKAGWNYHEILRFYYGDDIIVTTTAGDCISADYDAVCGDGTCDVGESCQDCPSDCGACTHDCTSRTEPSPIPCDTIPGACMHEDECDLNTNTIESYECDGPTFFMCCSPKNPGDVVDVPDDPVDPESLEEGGSCFIDGVEGVCMDYIFCPEDTHMAPVGYCPGLANAIRCCAPRPCLTDGFCTDVNDCNQSTHELVPGYCPGDETIQCCNPL